MSQKPTGRKTVWLFFGLTALVLSLPTLCYLLIGLWWRSSGLPFP